MKTPALAGAVTVSLLCFGPNADAQSCPTSSDAMAQGIVYEDLDLDGRRGPSDPGVPHVSVSNGCEVTRTDDSGRYRLPLADGQILFVTQPSGYAVATDEHQRPQFHCLHYPEGSVSVWAGEIIDWQWSVIEPTGPLPEQLDFALTRSETGDSFRAHAFADPQAGTAEEQDRLRHELLGALLGNPYDVSFSLTVGDVVNDNLGLYERHAQTMAQIGAPSWVLPGNHDINFRSPDAVLANETFKRHFGPTYYSFEVGSVHVVALNNVEYAGRGGNPSFENGRYRGWISEDQLYWLERDLAHVPPETLIVVASHIPLVTEAPGGDGRVGGDGLNTGNFSRLLDLLRPFSKIYGLAGHDTSNSWKTQVDHRHGWRGSPWIAHTLAEVRGNGWSRGPRDSEGVPDAMMQDGNPNGFYVLHFEGSDLRPEFLPFPTGPDAHRRLRITFDPPLHARAEALHRGVPSNETRIVVNLFDGGERDRVTVRVDDGPPLEMEHTLRTDPTFERLHQRVKGTDAAVGAPALSSHVWVADLPGSLSPGVHVLRVHAVDEFGAESRGALSFEVEAEP